MARLVLIIAGLCFFLVAVLCVVAYRAMFHPRRRSLGYTRDRGLERGEFSEDFLKLPWMDFRVESPNGYTIQGTMLAAAAPFPAAGRATTALFVHGISWNRFGMYKYMKIFAAKGWNVAAIDLANHGETKGPAVYGPSYGYYEKLDVAAAVKALRGLFPETPALGLVGESLGAATVLQYASLPPDPFSAPVAFIIADCSFTSAAKELDAQLAALKMPKLIRLNVGCVVSFLSKILRGFRLEDASPEKASRIFDTPVLYVHGAEDTYVPTRMSVEMYTLRKEAGKSATELLLVPGARHAKSYMTDPALWEARAFGFIDRYAFGLGEQDGGGDDSRRNPIDKAR